MIFYIDGNFIDKNEKVFPLSSRALRYGDGVFESIACFKDSIPLLEKHMLRLQAGMLALGFKSSLKLEEIALIIDQLKKRNGLQGSFRTSLYYMRKGSGYYTPETNEGMLIIQVKPLENSHFKFNEAGNTADFYEDNRKTCGSVSEFKTCSSLLYVLAGNFCRNNSLDDCLILGEDLSVAESYSSNIFIVSNAKVFTPSLSSGCVAGIMRDELIRLCLSLDIKIEEKLLTRDEVLQAEELFTTNAVSGIQWISSLRSTSYKCNVSKYLSDELNKKWGLKAP